MLSAILLELGLSCTHYWSCWRQVVSTQGFTMLPMLLLCMFQNFHNKRFMCSYNTYILKNPIFSFHKFYELIYLSIMFKIFSVVVNQDNITIKKHPPWGILVLTEAQLAYNRVFTLGRSYAIALMTCRIPCRQVMGTNSRYALWHLVPGCLPSFAFPPSIGSQPLFWITLVLSMSMPCTQCAPLKL